MSSRQDIDDSAESGPLLRSAIQSSIPDIKKVTQDLLQQTDSVFGGIDGFDCGSFSAK